MWWLVIIGMKCFLHALAALCVATSSFAAPAEFEAPNFKVIVIRPFDQWAPDSVLDKNNRVLNKFAEKEYSYSFYTSAADYSTQKSDDSLAKAISVESEKYGWKPNTSWAEKLPNNRAQIKAPSTLSPKEAQQFFAIQEDYWSRGVLSQGDPATFTARLQEKRDGSGIVALATTMAGMIVGGRLGGVSGINTGFQATLGSGFAGSVENMANSISASLAYVQPPKTDLSSYNSVDIRAIKLNSDRSGQIIIAYKVNKTADLEISALKVALPMALSMDETIDQIELARKADFSARQSLWSSCVAKGECKNEISQ